MRKSQAIEIRPKVSAIRLVLVLTVVIMGVKFLAYSYSGSQAILSDALESFINIATSSFTLFSLLYGSRLRDEDHPYGHGKVEYFAVAVEGVLILGTGAFIIYHAVPYFFEPRAIRNVDLGMWLTLVSVVAMWAMSVFLMRRGRRLDSMSLRADAIHLRSDAITSIGLIAGLVLYKVTGWYWIDPLLAVLLALHIMWSGYKLVREGSDRLMDKADFATIERLVNFLQKERTPAWIDIHNLRLQKFGQYLHVDCHLTLPFFYTLEQAHDEVKVLEKKINREFNHHVELFVHTDPCQQLPCNLCQLSDCSYRKQSWVQNVEWNSENLMKNRKHRLDHLPIETIPSN